MIPMALLGFGALPIPFMIYGCGGWKGTLAVMALFSAIAIGLRSSIVVTEGCTVITRRWFFIPYWRRSAPGIDDVWFGGDWGDEDGAMGVVVEMRGKEIHLGSSKTMRQLHAALFPLSAKGKRLAQQAAATDRAENGAPVEQ
jgi:hypothetical protein